MARVSLTEPISSWMSVFSTKIWFIMNHHSCTMSSGTQRFQNLKRKIMNFVTILLRFDNLPLYQLKFEPPNNARILKISLKLTQLLPLMRCWKRKLYTNSSGEARSFTYRKTWNNLVRRCTRVFTTALIERRGSNDTHRYYAFPECGITLPLDASGLHVQADWLGVELEPLWWIFNLL